MASAEHRLALVLEARNEAKQALNEVREDLGSVRDTAAGAWQGLSSAIPGLGTILSGAGLAGGALGAWQLGQKAIELSKIGAAADRAAEAFERRLGGDATAALEKLRIASQGTISDMGLMESATKAQMLGVADDAETLAGLLEVASRRGRDLGMGTAAAFSDIVTGIGRLSPMLLDNLGIVMDAKGTYESYAEAIGKTADALTEVEKRQALVERVLQEATGDPGTLDAAGRIEAEAAAWENFTTALGQNLTELTRIQGDTAQILQFLADEMKESATSSRQAETATISYKERLSELAAEGELGAATLGLIDQRAAQMVDAFEAGNSTLEATELNLDMLFAAVGGLVERTDLATVSEFEFREALAEVLETLHPYTTVVSEVPTLLDLAMQATADYGVMLGEQARDFDAAAASALTYANALGVVSDEMFLIDARGDMPRPKVRPPVVSATERYAIEERKRLEAEREAERHASTMQRLYEEQQATLRSMAESILTPTEVTPADMFRAQTGALGGYVEKWDESARRLQDIANRGAASPWWEVLEIPEEVLAQGEEAVRIWAQETADAVQRGVRPDMIDWEAFDRAAEEFQRDQEARERTIAMAMERLGGAVPETEVRQMLGVPADAREEALAVGEAFQQGLGAVDMARAVTERFNEQMQAQMQRWVTMGSMTVTWFARGLEEGVADDTGLRIAKKLWPMIAPMIDSYLAKGVWN